MRILIPHASIIAESDDVSRSSLNTLIRRALDASAEKPSALEIHDATTQRFLLLREKQIYAAAEATGGQLNPITIRDFMLGATHMNFPRATIFELSTKLLHSILVVTQKKPALRVMTNLVDLDELIDKIEAEGKSCIVCASRDAFLAVLRYEKGKASAFCWEKSVATPRESSFREEFLVRVYTQAAVKPLTVSLYEDFLVSFAPDAKNLSDNFHGRFEDVFLSKPPVLILRFKDREIGRWEMDRAQLRIGRTPDNDIVVDNLAVSRLHAVIEEDRGSYVARDCDSLNGTEVNGERITRRVLKEGDEISIGKHVIAFRSQSGHSVAEADAIAGFDQTMVMSRSQLAAAGTGTPAAAPSSAREPLRSAQIPAEATISAPTALVDARPMTKPSRLVIHSEHGEHTVMIAQKPVTIGNDEACDVRIDAMFVAPRHAEIVREDGHVLLRRIAGLRPLRVNGRVVRECELKDKDEIQLASELMVFHE